MNAKTIRAYLDVADTQHRPHYVPRDYGHYDWSIQRRTREFFPTQDVLDKAHALWNRYTRFREHCATLKFIAQDWSVHQAATPREVPGFPSAKIVEVAYGRTAQHAYHDATPARWRIELDGKPMDWATAPDALKSAIESVITAPRAWRDEFKLGQGECVYWVSVYNIGD